MTLNLSPVFGITSGTWVLPDGPLDCALTGAALCLMRAMPGSGDCVVVLVRRGSLRRSRAVFQIFRNSDHGGAFLFLLAHDGGTASGCTGGRLTVAGVPRAAGDFFPFYIWNVAEPLGFVRLPGGRAEGCGFTRWRR